MATFTQIQAAANAEAAAHPMSTLGPVPPLGGGLVTLNVELTTARVLEQLDSGISWLKNRENHGVHNTARTTLGNYDAARSVRATAKLVAGNLTNQLTAFNTRLSVNPLSTTELADVTTQLNAFVGPNTPYIRNDASLILTVATLRHTIATKSLDLPRNLTAPINLTQGGAPVPAGAHITTRPVAITGIKNSAAHTMELRDRAGTILASDGNTTGTAFDFPDIRNLANGWQDLVIRITNPTTNVIHDIPYRQYINLPVAPVKPEGLNNSTSATSTTRGTIAGRRITAGHTLALQDSTTGAPILLTTPPAPATPDQAILLPGGNGGFTIQLPIRTNPGPHEFRLIVTNGNITDNHTEIITLNVTAPTAPTIAPVSIATPARLSHNVVPLGEHHVHVHLDNPVPGSEVVISGDGLPTPVTVNIPNPITDLPASMLDPHGHVILTLPGFDTHTAGVKNMVIKTTDAHNTTNTLETKFTILVEEDPHHLPDNRKIGEAAFLAATRATPRIYTLQNDDPAGRTYRIGRLKRAMGIGWWAEVPVLPGEEKWFGRTKTVKSTSRTGLYAKVREYLKDLNARAAAMNHGDHDEDGEHHTEHPETPTPHTAPSGNNTHEAAVGGHAEGHGSEAKGGKIAGAVAAVGKTAAWPVGGALAGLGYAAWAGGAVLLGPAVVGGAVAGASIWAIRRLWRIKNPKKGGGEEKAHH